MKACVSQVLIKRKLVHEDTVAHRALRLVGVPTAYEGRTRVSKFASDVVAQDTVMTPSNFITC